MNHFLAIDIGTTDIKFKLFENEKGSLVFKFPVQTYYEGNSVYQRPDEILTTVKKGIRKVLKEKKKINQIAFSTAMHTIIPIQKKNPNLKMYLWSDKQATDIINKFKKTELAREFYYRTGTPIHSMSPFSKILHIKETRPDEFKLISHFQDLKSYLFSELAGENVTDYSNATATGLFNSLDFKWDQDILEYLKINESMLPTCFGPKETFSLLRNTIGLNELEEEIELVLGSSDGCLAALAAYKRTGSCLTVTLGTSGAVRKIVFERKIDWESQQFCYYVTDGIWVIGGATNNGGGVLEWLQNSFYNNKINIYSHLPILLNQMNYKNCLKSLPIFIPYIQGERAPIWDSGATGQLVGLSIKHTQDDIILSVVEGIFFNLKLIYENSFMETQDFLVLSGGVFKIEEFLQLISNIFSKNVCLVEETEPVDGLIDKTEINKELVEIIPQYKKTQYYNERYKTFLKQISNQ